jgi:hypothetical protein
VAHTCNPSYSDQEDHGLKPARANSSRDPISKIPNTKKAGGVAQGIGVQDPVSKKKKLALPLLPFLGLRCKSQPTQTLLPKNRLQPRRSWIYKTRNKY